MLKNIYNLLISIQSRQKEILSEFNKTKNTLISEITVGATLNPIIDRLNLYSSNKFKIPSLNGIAEAYSELDIISISITEYERELNNFSFGWGENYPMRRHYIAFSDNDNAIGKLCFVKHIEGSSKNHFKIQNWNKGEPNDDKIDESYDNLLMIVDVWCGELPMTDNQVLSYYRHLSQIYPDSERLHAI
jgi:hypothetical protein